MLEVLFPEIANKKKEEQLDELLYVFLFEAGWSWDKFKQTPIPIINKMLEIHIKKLKEQNKANKRKK